LARLRKKEKEDEKEVRCSPNWSGIHKNKNKKFQTQDFKIFYLEFAEYTLHILGDLV